MMCTTSNFRYFPLEGMESLGPTRFLVVGTWDQEAGQKGKNI